MVLIRGAEIKGRREGERKREKEREKEKKRDREGDRERKREKKKKRERGRERWGREREREREMHTLLEILKREEIRGSSSSHGMRGLNCRFNERSGLLRRKIENTD